MSKLADKEKVKDKSTEGKEGDKKETWITSRVGDVENEG